MIPIYSTTVLYDKVKVLWQCILSDKGLVGGGAVRATFCLLECYKWKRHWSLVQEGYYQ